MFPSNNLAQAMFPTCLYTCPQLNKTFIFKAEGWPTCTIEIRFNYIPIHKNMHNVFKWKKGEKKRLFGKVVGHYINSIY